MDSELKMAAEHCAKHGVTVRLEPPDRREERETLLGETLSKRKMLRIEADDLFRDGFGAGDVVAAAIRLVRLSFANAGAALQFGCYPQFEHFCISSKELVMFAQKNLDQALATNDWHAARVAIAQMQTIIYGLSVDMGLPYTEVVAYLHGAYVNGEEPERATVANILRGAGIEVAEEAIGAGEAQAANDAEPPEVA